MERALRMADVCARHGVPPRGAALRFPLGHPAVAGVLLGARSPEEVADGTARIAERLPGALRAEGLLGEGVPVPGEDGSLFMATASFMAMASRVHDLGPPKR